METPILETERLYLRPLTAKDAPEAYANWTSDPAVARFMRWSVHESAAETAEWLAAEEANSGSDTSYVWGFVSKADGALIGSGGLLFNEEAGLFEPGYNLMRGAWGQGYTTEAMREILRFGWETLGLEALYCIHAAENAASGAVLRKLGFVYWRDGAYEKLDGSETFRALEYKMQRPAEEREKME